MNVGAGTGYSYKYKSYKWTYSFKHTGNGSDSVSNRVYYHDTNPYFSATFNFKLLTQGVGT